MVVEQSNKITYIIYVKGRARIVTKDEWEADWLRWYKKISKDRN